MSDTASDTTSYETAQLLPGEASEWEFKAPAPEPSLLLSIPSEILILIGEAMDVEGKICFSLTCKRIYELVDGPGGCDLGGPAETSYVS